MAVKHVGELNEQIMSGDDLNLKLKQQVIQLEAQIKLLLDNKKQYSEVLMLTNVNQQEQFDNLRQRLKQKDAQIADMQVLLER